MEFKDEVTHLRRAMASSSLRTFAVPHFVVDNIFPELLIQRINDSWPDHRDGFQPEVPGNYILHVHRLSRLRMTRQRFWRAFNAKLWPAVIAAASELLSKPLAEAFGEHYSRSLSSQSPLTLMQADPTYAGHGMHTHFYHCPHWAFTMLLYVDPDDKCSHGTGLHRLLPLTGPNGEPSSYQAADLAWRADVAMDTFHWLDPQKPDRRYHDEIADYRSNRLFVFMDGPLALHSVPFDNPDGRPDPARAADNGRHARRRILRSHVRVEEKQFFAKHSASLPAPIDLKRYAYVMAPNRVLSPDDQRYRDEVLRPFYQERIRAYARAAEAYRRPVSADPSRPFGEGFYLPRKFSVEALKRHLSAWS
jgi:hypothetical protein